MLRVKLRHLDTEISNRRRVGEQYLGRVVNPVVQLPEVGARESHVWHLFVIRSEARDDLHQFLAESGIQTLIHYPIPAHQQKAFSIWKKNVYPLTESIHKEVLSLPMSPSLSETQVNLVAEAVNSFKRK